MSPLSGYQSRLPGYAKALVLAAGTIVSALIAFAWLKHWLSYNESRVLLLAMTVGFLALGRWTLVKPAESGRRMALRGASQSDSDALYSIHEAALRDYVAATWGRWDETEQRTFWQEHWCPRREVIDVDGEMAGFLDVEDRDDHVWVGNIELAPPFQGQQIGTTILTDIQRDAAKRGLDVRLQVLKVNPARRLYERLGFELTGETETHYQMAWRATRG